MDIPSTSLVGTWGSSLLICLFLYVCDVIAAMKQGLQAWQSFTNPRGGLKMKISINDTWKFMFIWQMIIPGWHFGDHLLIPRKVRVKLDILSVHMEKIKIGLMIENDLFSNDTPLIYSFLYYGKLYGRKWKYFVRTGRVLTILQGNFNSTPELGLESLYGGKPFFKCHEQLSIH